jgi:hypothetical protein
MKTSVKQALKQLSQRFEKPVYQENRPVQTLAKNNTITRVIAVFGTEGGFRPVNDRFKKFGANPPKIPETYTMHRSDVG